MENRIAELNAEIARVTRVYASKPAVRRVILESLRADLAMVSK